jgi:L-threonylcarbamoyladenylate synthase
LEVLRLDAAAPDEATVARALAVLRAGGLLIYPTDTLYAFGGRALDPRAATRVLRAKRERHGKPLPLIAADLGQVHALCAALPVHLTSLAERFWPGPLTLVLPAAAVVPAEVTAGTGTVAVRIPALPLARRLCAHGPLISTSANRSGGPPPIACDDAVAALGEDADLAIDAGPGRPHPSTILDLSGSPKLLREGAIAASALEDVLRGGNN